MSREIFEDKALSRYDNILNDFRNLAINRFEWNNLPLGLDSEILEQMLIERGQAFCFKRKNGGLTILPCTGSNRINIYGQYEEYVVTGLNGNYIESIDAEKGVRIKNNPLASDNISNLEIYAKRIDDLEMTQDVNMFQQNVPKILLMDSDSKLTFKNIIKDLMNFKFIIKARKSIASQLKGNEVLDTTAPFVIDKLQDHKQSLINEVLTYLGINNANTDKKERLVIDEVNANNDFININLDLMYDLRKRACDDINEMFGTNIEVKKREIQQEQTKNDIEHQEGEEEIG